MSVVINTNFAATLAANNLASSNQALQRSLNRLSSGSKIVNPADDAGGLAVSMKLSAAAKRQGAAAANIGNSASFLQSQDGVLKTVGKVLERIGELKTLAFDPTKNSTDLDNYNAEFAALQDQLTSLAAETFNGKALFGSNNLSVATTEDGTGAITMAGVQLLGGDPVFSDDFANLSNWTGGSGASVSGGVMHPPTFGNGVLETTQSFSGAFELNFDLRAPTAGTDAVLIFGSDEVFRFDAGTDIAANSWVSVRVVVDGAGSASTYLNGSATAAATATGLPTTTTLGFFSQQDGGTPVDIRSLTVDDSTSSTDTKAVTQATDLTSLSLGSITGALQEVATYRADNGAQQSRLGYAAEVLATNKANLEAASSRITDVDVASESTQMARYNILVQAGTAMLSQANQSAQSALRLIG